MAKERTIHVEDDIARRSDDAWTYQFQVPNQNYAVITICENDKPGGQTGIKIFGVFRTVDDANRAAKSISQENDFFDVYVADTNAWVPIPPGKDFVEDVEYQEQRMKEIKESFTKMKERNANALKREIESSHEKKQND